ncbi:MAG: hypothetical protein RSF42_16685 [Comamonas sp.]
MKSHRQRFSKGHGSWRKTAAALTVFGALISAQTPARAQSDMQFVPFMQLTPKERTQQELLLAIERGDYADAGPISGDRGNALMASSWEVFHGQQGMPNFANSSQAHIFASTWLAVVGSINAATWGKTDLATATSGSAIRGYAGGASFESSARNLTDPYTLQFCGAHTNQCVQLMEQWIRAVGDASQRGAQQRESNRIAEGVRRQEAIAAQARANDDAVSADIAAQAARIRAKQSGQQ